MDDGVDYMHPDLYNNYVSTEFRQFTEPNVQSEVGKAAVIQ